MDRMALLAAIALTALNLGILAVNVSIQAKAEVAGMGWRELSRDRDFKRAVEDIVESCTVDDGSLSC